MAEPLPATPADPPAATAGRSTTMTSRFEMGRIDLTNGETWTTRDDRTYRICDLEESHARNILRFLERNAAGFELMFSLNVVGALPPEMGEMAEMMIESELYESAVDPVGWIRKTPAYQAIAARLFEEAF